MSSELISISYMGKGPWVSMNPDSNMADFDAELFTYYTANNYIHTKPI